MSGPDSRGYRALVILGGSALLVATAVDGLAVLGRHVAVPLLGSIEAVQAAVLVSGAVALLIATVTNRHARVHLLVDRLSAKNAAMLQRSGFALGAVLFGALGTASAWIAMDLWHGHEESEWLHIPYAPLRVMTIVSAAAVALAFIVKALRRRGG